MRFVVFSDLHLYEWTYGATYINGMNSRLLAQANVLNQIKTYCLENNIWQIVFCGDLFHTHAKVTAPVLKVAYECFQSMAVLGLELTFLVGNHDFGNKTGSIHMLEFLKTLGCVIDRSARGCVIDRSAIGTDLFSLISYTEDAEELKDFISNTPKGHYLFMHQGVSGVPLGSGFVIPNEILNPADIPSGVLAFTGHYHSHKKVSPNLYVVGSPMQHDWSDAGEVRGWLDVDGLSVTQIESVAPKFVKLNPGNVFTAKDLTNNYVRVKANPGEMDHSIFEKAGVSSIEYDTTKETDAQELIAVDSFELEPLIRSFEVKNNVSPELIQLGRDLRQ